jgi:hypothetical protein
MSVREVSSIGRRCGNARPFSSRSSFPIHSHQTSGVGSNGMRSTFHQLQKAPTLALCVMMEIWATWTCSRYHLPGSAESRHLILSGQRNTDGDVSSFIRARTHNNNGSHKADYGSFVKQVCGYDLKSQHILNYATDLFRPRPTARSPHHSFHCLRLVRPSLAGTQAKITSVSRLYSTCRHRYRRAFEHFVDRRWLQLDEQD